MHPATMAAFLEEVTTGMAKRASFLSTVGSEAAEHATDIAGLGMMAAGSADRLRRQMRGNPNPEEGETARVGADLAGLGTMAVPTMAALATKHLTPQHAGGGSRLTNVINAAGLGSLALSAGDKLQARLRAAPGENPEDKQFMGHTGHAVADLAGLGTLAGPALVRALGKGRSWGDAAQLAGYATLAAPVADDLQAHLRTPHGEDDTKKKFLPQGAGRSASELAGLGLLAAPVAHHMMGGGH